MRRRWMWIGPLAIVGMVVFVAIGGMVVMQLWNWLLPGLFGWHPLTFWQAVGMLALCRILFGGFGFHGRSKSQRRGWGDCESVAPEEREKFRQKMRERWGAGPAAG